MDNNSLFNWCLEQAHLRYTNQLSQEQLDKLNALNFPWAYYEEELTKLGYHWEKNKPKKACTYDEEIDAWLEKHPDWSGDCRYGATKEMSYFEYCSCEKPVFCGCESCS